MFNRARNGHLLDFSPPSDLCTIDLDSGGLMIQILLSPKINTRLRWLRRCNCPS